MYNTSILWSDAKKMWAETHADTRYYRLPGRQQTEFSPDERDGVMMT
jgi:hypothetical protein